MEITGDKTFVISEQQPLLGDVEIYEEQTQRITKRAALCLAATSAAFATGGTLIAIYAPDYVIWSVLCFTISFFACSAILYDGKKHEDNGEAGFTAI